MKKLLFSIVFSLIAFGFINAQNSINNTFFDHVDYIGAFGDNNWTSPWANWDPQNTVYPATTTTIAAGNITSDQTWSSGNSPLFNAASFSGLDPFFTPTTYIGAFDGTTDWTSPWANWDPQNTVYPVTTVTIPAGEITTNTTWTSGNVYKLNGFVYVRDGATLTIQAGTIIRGDKTNQGTLIVERGAKLVAIGNAAQPIVFTSNQAAGSRDYGDWGGVILLGKATINVPGGVATIEGGVGSQYGGTDDTDNSGTLKYVRIEFPGIAFEPNNEINGLTMGGVGNTTSIDYVQVSYSGDDSYEWFGGTVNAKHLIAFRGWDDDFDTDFGFHGKIQFGVALRDPDIADVSGSNCFESDNDGSGSSNTPITHPLFSNMSIFGPRVTPSTPINSQYKRAMHLRRNTMCSIYNSVFTGWNIGLFIDGAAAQANATNNDLQIQNMIMSGMATNFVSSFEEDYFFEAFRQNTVLTENSSLNIADPYNLTNPDFQPQTGNTVYKLDGFVYVKSGATLTIEPGTIIRGDKTNKGTLIVEPGGKLLAEGTANAPIIFTSNQGVGSRDYGDWGGVILLGNAVINVPGGTATIEGGVGSTYGGANDADNSGTMKYCRLEFPGIAFEPNNEINGLTMGGVGSGTTLDYIQVSYSGDDSYEWFGGFVNAKHLIAFRGWDDDFDTDFGYRGMVQYAVSLRDPAIADVSGSNSFESDNDGSGSSNTPLTAPVFSNVSIFLDNSGGIHSDYKRAMHLRRNTDIDIYNAFFTGWPIGLFIDGTAAQANATAGTLNVSSTILAGITTNYVSTFEQTYFETAARENGTEATAGALMITDPFNLTNPNFLPMTSSPVRHRSYWTVQLSGTVTYNNGASTPLSGVTVNISDGAKGVVLTATTDGSGNYTIPRIGEGNYTLTLSSTTPYPPAGTGVNTQDAQISQAHFLGNTTLTGLRFLAADINKNGTVNTIDASNIARRSIGLSVPAWTASDWIFESPSISVSTSDLTQDVQGIISGDANGSYTPSK